MKKIILQQEPVDVAAVLNEVGEDSDGAVAVFIGRPRNKSHDSEVTHLTYEIFESMAEKELGKIVDYAFSNWPVTSCIVIHRYGRVEIKEPSIVIAVSSPHREEAFASVRYIIDTIKQTVPIWKTEYFPDGTSKVYDRS
ncbi:MAG: molybdenum cofactor biosynthesis protein MoaE [Spirochaetes bacterium]|nr:molybdenum cofactor biosynthesis protein MoaE [Spirochaetota bacterium]